MGDTREITVEVDEWTARRLVDLEWEQERSADDIAQLCLREGVRRYESALSLNSPIRPG